MVFVGSHGNGRDRVIFPSSTNTVNRTQGDVRIPGQELGDLYQRKPADNPERQGYGADEVPAITKNY
jgi:hypothetical protein